MIKNDKKINFLVLTGLLLTTKPSVNATDLLQEEGQSEATSPSSRMNPTLLKIGIPAILITVLAGGGLVWYKTSSDADKSNNKGTPGNTGNIGNNNTGGKNPSGQNGSNNNPSPITPPPSNPKLQPEGQPSRSPGQPLQPQTPPTHPTRSSIPSTPRVSQPVAPSTPADFSVPDGTPIDTANNDAQPDAPPMDGPPEAPPMGAPVAPPLDGPTPPPSEPGNPPRPVAPKKSSENVSSTAEGGAPDLLAELQARGRSGLKSVQQNERSSDPVSNTSNDGLMTELASKIFQKAKGLNNSSEDTNGAAKGKEDQTKKISDLETELETLEATKALFRQAKENIAARTDLNEKIDVYTKLILVAKKVTVADKRILEYEKILYPSLHKVVTKEAELSTVPGYSDALNKVRAIQDENQKKSAIDSFVAAANHGGMNQRVEGFAKILCPEWEQIPKFSEVLKKIFSISTTNTKIAAFVEFIEISKSTEDVNAKTKLYEALMVKYPANTPATPAKKLTPSAKSTGEK